jgi:ABC-type molybdate transport system substrate-binding protein
MGRHWSGGAVAVLLAGSLVVPVTSGIATATRTGAVPKTVAGAWSRKLTQAFVPSGVWTMVIKKGGRVDFYIPEDDYTPGCIAKSTCTPDSSTTFTFSGGRLTIASAPPCGMKKGTYAWNVTGASLTLRVINDPLCPDRQTVMKGVWTRTRL